jgi:hypothetical protein
LLRRAIDEVTRPRIFVFLGLVPTPTGRETLAAAPRWLAGSARDATKANAAADPSAALHHMTATASAAEVEPIVHARLIRTDVNARNRLLPHKPGVSSASAYDVPGRLNDVARVYSLGVGEIRCPTQVEWDAYYASAFAWGSTNLREDYTTLAPFICQGALTLGDSSTPLWQQAAGVWVLVHEAFHLRHWRFRRNEAKVACQAIVYFRDAAMRLGASEQQAEELYPYALALHIRQVELFSWYRDKSCHAPLWVPPTP